MKIHRFYIKDTEFVNELHLNKKNYPELHNQLFNVLKLRTDEMIELFNSNQIPANRSASINNIYKVKLIDNKNIILNLEKSEKNIIDEYIENKCKINLYIANIKKENLELVIEKAVELGVSNIHLLETDRSQRINTKINNIARLKKIIIEATEQSGRGQLTNIYESTDLEKALNNMGSSATNYACIIPKRDKNTILNTKIKENGFNNINKPANKEGVNTSISIWVGPEGGWTEKEDEQFTFKDFSVLNLGHTVLRSETAAIAAIAKFL